jgi:hypothetical protein
MTLVINTQRSTNKDQTKKQRRHSRPRPTKPPTELLVLALTVDTFRYSSRSSMVRHKVPSSADSQAATSSFHSRFSSFAKRRKSHPVGVHVRSEN